MLTTTDAKQGRVGQWPGGLGSLRESSLRSYTQSGRLPVTALHINIIPLPVTMNKQIKNPLVKLNFQQSQ